MHTIATVELPILIFSARVKRGVGERVYASFEKGIAEFRSAQNSRKAILLQTFFGLLLITFTYTKHLMRP